MLVTARRQRCAERLIMSSSVFTILMYSLNQSSIGMAGEKLSLWCIWVHSWRIREKCQMLMCVCSFPESGGIQRRLCQCVLMLSSNQGCCSECQHSWAGLTPSRVTVTRTSLEIIRHDLNVWTSWNGLSYRCKSSSVCGLAVNNTVQCFSNIILLLYKMRSMHNHSYYESLHLCNILHEVPCLMWFTPSENTLNVINQIHHLSEISLAIIFTSSALINQIF